VPRRSGFARQGAASGAGVPPRPFWGPGACRKASDQPCSGPARPIRRRGEALLRARGGGGVRAPARGNPPPPAAPAGGARRFRVNAGGVPQAKAGQRDHLVADGADPVLGLPPPAPFDAYACVECVVPSKADEVVAGWRTGRFELGGLTENGAPGGSERAEVVRGGEGDVDLQPGGEEEHTVDRGSGRQVPVVPGSEFLAEGFGPACQGRAEPTADDECQVDVRPAVVCADCVGTGDRRSCDVGIGPSAMVRSCLRTRSRRSASNMAQPYPSSATSCR
jgi:hypothetical protein